MIRNNPSYLLDPVPKVIVSQLNDYNVVIELQVWLNTEREHIRTRKIEGTNF